MTGILRKLFPYKDMGWEEIGETFIRYTLLKTPWFQIFLHQIDAPRWHPQCHDHPWDFTTVILWNGYAEHTPDRRFRWRRPGSVLFRKAEFAHNVITPKGVAWSLVFASPKRRAWGYVNYIDEPLMLVMRRRNDP